MAREPLDAEVVYRFPTRRTIALLFSWFLTASMSFAGPYIVFKGAVRGPGAGIVQILLVGIALGFLVFPAWYALRRDRPVGVGKDGASSYFLGYRFIHIAWSDVRSIVKVRRGIKTSPRYFYRIVGPGREIIVSDGLLCFDSLISAIDSYAAAHHVSVVEK